MINFNVPPFTGKEMDYIKECVENQKICGDGIYTKRCNEWIEKKTDTTKCLLTTSCTHALEMAALLADIQPGDEVIMPAYTFVSTADAFVLRGAVPVFVDIRPDTMNIDENLIEAAITDKTKAIAPVHYAGVACEMDKIMELAKKYNLFVIEDAAQGIITSDFVNKYIDRILVTPEEDGSMRLDIKIFTGESTQRYLEKLVSRTGHTFKKMIEAYEQGLQ